MATFEVKVRRIKAIEPIPGADSIELAVIEDYRSVVEKYVHQPGDLCVYIPEGALIPTNVLEYIGLTGKLAGKDKNRVKAAKFRGCLSQGIVYGVEQQSNSDCVILNIPATNEVRKHIVYVEEGDNVASQLGITKWEPEIPTNMAGEVYNAGSELTVAYDVENVKNYPELLQEGELVEYSEKAHGSFFGIAILPKHLHDPKHFKGKFVVFSKGLGAKGLCFKDNEANVGNVYIRALNKFDVFNKLEQQSILNDTSIFSSTEPVFLLGEVFGDGIQDLTYGGGLQIRVFDICTGFRGNQTYLGYEAKLALAESIGVELVPSLYNGPHSEEKMIEFTSGKESISGKGLHIREGIVIRPLVERRDEVIGRIMLKSVSEEYLLRKGNVTEYS